MNSSPSGSGFRRRISKLESDNKKSEVAINIENGIEHIAAAGKSLVKGLQSLGVFDKIAEKINNKKKAVTDDKETKDK